MVDPIPKAILRANYIYGFSTGYPAKVDHLPPASLFHVRSCEIPVRTIHTP